MKLKFMKLKYSALLACLWISLQNVILAQESAGATYALTLGRSVGQPGGEVEIPLALSTGGEVQGAQVVFDWDGSAGTGVDLIVDPAIEEAAEFVDFHVDEDWMALGIVTLSSPLTGAGIPLATAVIRCASDQEDSTTPVVFRDGAHRIDLPLSNAVTVDCEVDCRSVRRQDGLELIDGSFRSVAPPCPVRDIVCESAAGVVRVSWTLGGETRCRTQALRVRAGSVTRTLRADATGLSISCASLDSSGTVSILSLGADGREEKAVCDYVCGTFSRGDGNDDGKVDVSDAVGVLSCLFRGRFCPGCLDAGDCNDDGRIDTSDAVCLLSCVFGTGICPAAPFPGCGVDTTGDDLGCGRYESC